MVYTEHRQRFVDWLRQQLIGPAQPDADNLVGESPLNRYPVGVLHPVMASGEGMDPANPQHWEEVPEATLDGGRSDRDLAQPTRSRRYVPPSSVGFSFLVGGRPRLQIVVSGSRYSRIDDGRDPRGRFLSREYKRIPLGDTTLDWVDGGPSPIAVSDRLGVDVQRKEHPEGAIITVSLFNPQRAQTGRRHQEVLEKCLFEVRLVCFVMEGELTEYPRVDRSLLTPEEQELEFQYRSRSIYAVGHGAAVDWTKEDGKPPCIQSEFMPAVEVPLVTTDLSGSPQSALGMSFLARENRERQLAELQNFVDGYAGWVAAQPQEEREAQTDGALQRIHDRMRTAVTRMQRGLDLLASDALANEAFRLANKAMLNQMRQQDSIQNKARAPEQYRWRPFQLAFILTVLESTVRGDDEFRDVCDLIWFPTGGGKTEAYLGLIAFLIAWRRMDDPAAGGGTVALIRYTLRLLTRQQFLRAARMICALELLRRSNPKVLGQEPITVGVWVGRAASPNQFTEAAKLAVEIRQGAASRGGLLLEACPWCGEEFTARSYRATESEFHFRCAESSCPFGRQAQPLPCNVVDEALYEAPPSLLIGTIDKFARLAWESRAASFFGLGTGQHPPSLIVQDELHLITGPLGSVAGLYEAALDSVLQLRGVKPKYIASTATIRMAREQVRSLYGRRVAVFPPPGPTCDDSYFARTDRERPGRLYLGYLAPGLAQTQSLAPLAAALLTAPMTLFADQADRAQLLEAWWTQVIYHGSLKSVGESHTAYLTDVRDWTGRFASEARPEAADAGSSFAATDSLHELVQARADNLRIDQLTSRSTAQDNARTFSRLERKRDEEDCLDVVLATNMVSVGLDVSRLALMVVNGQPLTTAEYIQTSSRVGRAEVPGLVCVNFHRTQARSLSHYENFRPYHDSFYRFVEPASVTPYTHQARLRALHAALVIAVRLSGTEMLKRNDAGRFDLTDPDIQAVTQALAARCALAEPADSEGKTAEHIEVLATQWHDRAQWCSLNRRKLVYDQYRDRGVDALLCSHENPEEGLWPTLHSMRNVEGAGILRAT